MTDGTCSGSITPTQILVRVLIACLLIVGAAKILDSSFSSTKARNADSDWRKCSISTARKSLAGNPNLNVEGVLLSMVSECKVQYEMAAKNCSSKNDCGAAIDASALRMINVLRNNFIAEREEARKRNQIEMALKELEKLGVDRDDLKSHFREEILEDEADDRKASAEASIESADQERPGRFGW